MKMVLTAASSSPRPDIPSIHLEIYRDVFRLPKAIGYLSNPERRFVTGDSIAMPRSKRRSAAASICRRITHIRRPPGRRPTRRGG